MVIAFAAGAWLFNGSSHRVDPIDNTATDRSQLESEEVFSCVMHPQIRQAEPGECPICGMDLVAVPTEDSGSGHESAYRVSLTERARALARIRTAPVERVRQSAMELRLLGRIESDESTKKTVTAWSGGRIDKLLVSVTGSEIKAGQKVALLYSPEIFAAHQDLLTAVEQVSRLERATESARAAARAALQSTRERLKLLGLPSSELTRMESSATPWRQIAVRSPFSGTVIERLATEGAYVATGAPLYRVADLSRVWVQLDAYERDLANLAVGQEVRLAVEAYADQSFEGRIAFIDPTLDPIRRTARVRVEVLNSEGRLRPGMFAEAVVTASASAHEENPLLIPDSAPLFTGRRSIVYVEVEGVDRPTYEARKVRLGPAMGAFYPVTAGLREGEHVVVHGAFALDADLQIRGGASMMSTIADRDGDPWHAAVAIDSMAKASLGKIVDAYLATQQALANDDLRAASEAAGDLRRHTIEASKKIELDREWGELAATLIATGVDLASEQTLAEARHSFGELTQSIEQLLQRYGNPIDEPIRVARCPMVDENRGGIWFQRDTPLANAYFGESMKTCGDIEGYLAPGAHLPATGEGRAANASPAKAPHGDHRH